MDSIGFEIYNNPFSPTTSIAVLKNIDPILAKVAIFGTVYNQLCSLILYFSTSGFHQQMMLKIQTLSCFMNANSFTIYRSEKSRSECGG